MASPRLRSKLTAVTLIAAAALATVEQAHADPDKVAYELAERCSASAEKFFAGLGYPNSNVNSAKYASEVNASSYENHYNPTLNTCFMLAKRQSLDLEKQKILIIRDIWNVNENRQVDTLACEASFKDVNTAGTHDNACLIGDFARVGEPQFSTSMRRYMER